MNSRFFGLILAVLFSTAVLGAQDRPDALELYKAGNFAGAVDICLKELAEVPNRMDAYAVLGWSLLRLRRYGEALDCAQKAMAISRYDPRIIEVAGESLYFLGRRREALPFFEEYAAISPTGGRIDQVYYLMGEIFIQQGRFHHADIALSTALYHAPNIADWWARLGYARENAGDLKSALEAFTKALALNPNLDEAARGKSRVEKRLSGG